MKIDINYGISGRIEELIENIAEVETVRQSNAKTIRLETVKWVSPLSILPLIIYVKNNSIDLICEEKDPKIKSYLKTIGFPNGVEDIRDSEKSYLPIMKISCNCKDSILSEYEDRIMNITNLNLSSFRTAVKFLTSELQENVKEHARIDHYWLLAQYWKERKICEVAIADTGIGYKESYKGTRYEVQTDLEAIKNALEGKSSKKIEERGAGIPGILKIFTEGYGGKVVIMSGNALVYYGRDKVDKYELPFNWKGAFVVINFIVKDIPIQDYY